MGLEIPIVPLGENYAHQFEAVNQLGMAINRLQAYTAPAGKSGGGGGGQPKGDPDKDTKKAAADEKMNYTGNDYTYDPNSAGSANEESGPSVSDDDDEAWWNVFNKKGGESFDVGGE